MDAFAMGLTSQPQGARLSHMERRRPSFSQLVGLSPTLPSEYDTDSEPPAPTLPAPMFTDPEAMKEKVRANLFKEPYDVSNFYHPTGLWRNIATHPVFDKLTLVVISVNAIWIGVDTDYNRAEVLLQADPLFQIMEHTFCVYFSFEWVARFMSFRLKRDGMRDAWFVFDSLLVCMMVMETWLLTAIMLMSGEGTGGGLGNTSILRMARLARLSRMARVARLLRATPELMILIKGLASATRSVFFTLCLLAVLLYIFAIAFTQLTAGTDVGFAYFDGVAASMYTLLVYGTLMDNIGLPLQILGAENMIFAALYLLFVLLATITVMNMLIGVLCEVVTTVAAVEKESLTVAFVKHKLERVLKQIDEDGSGSISREEFISILSSPDAIETLNEVGVDVMGIIELADFVFVDEDDSSIERELTHTEFMKQVLSFRGTNKATVKDVVDFHKFVKGKIDQTTKDLRDLKLQLLEDSQKPKMMKRRNSRTSGVAHQSKSNARDCTPDKLADAAPAAVECFEPGQPWLATVTDADAMKQVEDRMYLWPQQAVPQDAGKVPAEVVMQHPPLLSSLPPVASECVLPPWSPQLATAECCRLPPEPEKQAPACRPPANSAEYPSELWMSLPATAEHPYLPWCQLPTVIGCPSQEWRPQPAMAPLHPWSSPVIVECPPQPWMPPTEFPSPPWRPPTASYSCIEPWHWQQQSLEPRPADTSDITLFNGGDQKLGTAFPETVVRSGALWASPTTASDTPDGVPPMPRFLLRS